MKKKLFLLYLLALPFLSKAQNVGINTTSPLATLDVRGNQRFGGATQYMSYDSLSGKIVWSNSNLYVPVTQALMKHSAAADGLFYNNSGGVNGQLEYRNASGNPVFYTNFTNGNGYFKDNLGIGILNPVFPISFGPTIGDKISLWSNSTNSYGFGIQSSLLQIHTDIAEADIAFGYGSSSSFFETMRIRGNGNVGIGNNNPALRLDITGRMRIRTGSDGQAGIWLNNNANTGLQGFMGLENDTYVGLYGAAGAGWGLGMNTVNGDIKMMGRVGIGTSTPNAPLSFPAFLGKKITLYPGLTGDVGMAVQGNLLQIYADNPSADIALGYDQAGSFTERFRVRANGAVMVNGSAGNAGQLLQSNGLAAAPTWVNPSPKIQYFRADIPNTVLTEASPRLYVDVPVTIQANSIITVSITVNVSTAGYFGCAQGGLTVLMEPANGGGLVQSTGIFNTNCSTTYQAITTGEQIMLDGTGNSKTFYPGTDAVHLTFIKTQGPGTADITIGNIRPAIIVVKVVPL